MDEYVYENGEWVYYGDVKKETIDCNKCGTKTEMTEMERYVCKHCGRIFKVEEPTHKKEGHLSRRTGSQ
ncbi:MAG: hypothetical protein R6V53_07240 [Candidatus Woesearchaeota archaeon]